MSRARRILDILPITRRKKHRKTHRRTQLTSYMLVTAVIGLATVNAQAYPDMIRHNYVNCTACHVSPTGGGVLNAYGRSMSREVLSAWGGERETEFLHGALKENSIPEWLNIGGDVRAIQVHKESPRQLTERFFLMQASMEFAASFASDANSRLGGSRFTGVMAVGHADQGTRSIRMVSPRFYALWNPLDEISVRAGRFNPVFGVNVPYHTLPTRQSLGFAPGQERDTAEAMWSGETWNFGASLSRTPEGPVPVSQRENLVTAQVNRTFFDSHRLGFSYLSGSTSAYKREALGIHGLCGITEKLAYIFEFTGQRLAPTNGAETSGLYHFSQLLYEVKKGWSIYLLEDYEKSNLEDSRTLANSIGPGLRFFPRPHFEIDTVFLKRRVGSVADRYDDLAWIMLHYYF